MKNSGNLIFIFSIFFTALSPCFAEEVTFHLTQTKVEQDDDLILEARVGGDKEFKPIKSTFEGNRSKAIYVGNASETQIINFKVSRSQVLRFRVSTNTVGEFKIPQVQVVYNSQTYSSPDLSYVVEKRSHTQRNLRPKNFFDHFFEEPFQEEESNVKTEVAFHTNKQRVYIGEPVVGYYVLYYTGLRQAYLERDPNQSIAFPFFLSETLKQVSVQIDPFAIRKGIEKKTLVYEKEIYGLTPLKTGAFSLGSTKFLVGDSMRFGAIHESIPVSPARIEVIPLPQGAPNKFKAAIGDYQIHLPLTERKVHLGETLYFSVQVKGAGSGDGIEDLIPLTESIHLVSKTKKKTFKLLTNGEYGFYSELEFFYSIEPKEEGQLDLGTANLDFFSPSNHSYQTISKDLGNIQVLAKRPASEKSQNKSESISNPKTIRFYSFLFAGVLIIGISLGVISYIRKQNNIKESLSLLDEKIGNKRKEILEDYLQRKGIPLEESKLLVELKDSFPKEKFSEIYSYCEAEDKKVLIKISKKII